MEAAFWRNKTVFITGHTGFKGSWLCLWLQHLGAKVVGFSLPPPTQPSLYELAQVHNGMAVSHEGDIRNLAYLQQAILESAPDIVIHMAAQSLVRYSYQFPVETYATNVMGTVHVLESVRNTPSVRVVVNVTSDKCYENREWHWGYRENEPMGGHDPYSNSKGCAELVTSAYRQAFFSPNSIVSLASARAGNVIGGGDWAADRLLPDMMRAFLSRQAVIIRYPDAIRPWQHVLEPLSGYLQLAENLWNNGSAFAEGWNFGPNDEDAKPVRWIVEQCVQLWGEQASWHLTESPQLHEATYLKLDCAKSKAKLHWHPRWDIEQALQHTVSWYQAFGRGESMQDVTLSQIKTYGALIEQ
jgi:CDP-glucose 4,6-dehydratase